MVWQLISVDAVGTYTYFQQHLKSVARLLVCRRELKLLRCSTYALNLLGTKGPKHDLSPANEENVELLKTIKKRELEYFGDTMRNNLSTKKRYQAEGNPKSMSSIFSLTASKGETAEMASELRSETALDVFFCMTFF